MKTVDILGQRFGRLVVIEKIGRNKTGMYWKCDCDCGRKELEIQSYRLRKGKTTHCGCLFGEDLSKQKFNKLTPIKKIWDKNCYKWECLCDCGNKSLVRANKLKGLKTKSCGCAIYDYNHWTDITGQKFGRLTVLSFLKIHPTKGTIFICQCECNKIKEVNSGHLMNGHTKSCGCLSNDEKRSRTGKNNWKYDENLPEFARKYRRSSDDKKWGKLVKKLHNYTCAKCHQKFDECALDAHHIQNYIENPSLRLDKNNGVCFCACCHRIFHKKYGLSNNTPEQIGDYLKNVEMRNKENF